MQNTPLEKTERVQKDEVETAIPVGHRLVSFPVDGHFWQLAVYPSRPLSSHTGSQISKFSRYTDLTAVLQNETLRSRHEAPLGQGTTQGCDHRWAFGLWPVQAFECGAERSLLALIQPLASDLLLCAMLNAFYV